MFRHFENLVDPYSDYEETDAPPQRLWPFLWAYSQPFKFWFAVAVVLSVIVAGVEIGLIYYMGALLVRMSTTRPM